MLGALARTTRHIAVQNSFTKACRTRRSSPHNPLTSKQTSNSQLQYPSGFQFWPHFLSAREQHVLLAASLQKLDATEMRTSRRKRKKYFEGLGLSKHNCVSLANLFAPDGLYEFQLVCDLLDLSKIFCNTSIRDISTESFVTFDLSNWPFDEFEELKHVLDRIHSLCPTADVQTHLLHLASYGGILPHVDNVSASGSWILGVSLGDERVLRMQPLDENEHEFSVVLASGSVYLQRDSVRFNYNHSIERPQSGNTGQRLSVMIRDRKPTLF